MGVELVEWYPNLLREMNEKKMNFDEGLEAAIDYAFLFYSDKLDVVQVCIDKLIDNIGRELTVDEVLKMTKKLERYLKGPKS